MKKIKLDENFPAGLVEVFRKADIDASSVVEQNLSGSPDNELYKRCIDEERILVTFDLDFANIIRFPSQTTAGIIVCRHRKKVNMADIHALCQTLINV